MALEADVVEELGERRRVVSAHKFQNTSFVHARVVPSHLVRFFACAVAHESSLVFSAEMSSRRRQLMAVLPLALMLSREPLIAKKDGKDGLRPLDVVVHSSVSWLRAVAPQVWTEYSEIVNATATAVLMPSHFGGSASGELQSLPSTAWQSAARAYAYLMREDATVQSFVQAPLPNAPVIGSYAVVVGALLAPFVPGLSEYTLIAGCLSIMRARVKLEMESQHPLHLMTTCAALMLVVIMRG